MKSLLKFIKNIATYMFRATKTDEYWINGFSDWFGSVQGFKQQTLIMAIWCAIVIVFPLIDPSMLHLMAFLTIYSAITQPILAFGTTKSNNYNIQLMKNSIHQMKAMMAIMERQEETNKRQERTIEQLNEVVARLSNEVEGLADEIQETKE